MTLTMRSVVSYHLYLVIVALFAFWVYYQTFDVNTASALATSGLEANGTATVQWAAEKQSWLQEHAAPVIELGRQVGIGMTSAS